MLSSEMLVDLNFKGFCPGPEESEQQFVKRIKLTRELIESPEEFFKKQPAAFFAAQKNRVKKPDLSWVNSTLMHLYGFYSESLPAYFSNEKLSFFEGAAVFLLDVQGHKIPLLQIRKELQKKKAFPFSLYKLEEILSHEMVHFLRSSFDEKKFEEFFAYLTSKHFLRRLFGPLVRSSKEAYVFLALLFASLGLEWGYLMFPSLLLKSLFLFSCSFTLSFLTAGIFRLIRYRKIFNRCLKNLKTELKEKALSCMARLTDEEICFISKLNKHSLFKHGLFKRGLTATDSSAKNKPAASFLKQYAFKKQKNSLRWKVIYLAYFS